jgi:drug/metabolite transporter (DMT)-like permease
MVLVLSLAAAICYAAGIVMQYHEAHQAPDRLFLSPRLLGTLARHPLWLAGLAVMFAGQGLQAVALDHGDLSVVEPALTLSLLFAIPLSAAWRRERVSRIDWTGAVLVCAGLGLLLGVGAPTSGHSNMPDSDWLIVVAGAWGATALLIVLGTRCRWPAPRAAMIGAASGVLFGLQDALTPSCLHLLTRHPAQLLISWQFYLFWVTAIYGIVLMQSAYKAGPLTAGLQTMTIGEPIAGMLIGIFALGERLGTTPTALALEALGAVVMILGSALLARSPLVCGRHHPSRLITEGLGKIEAKLMRPADMTRIG